MPAPKPPVSPPENANLSGGGWITQASGTFTSGSPELSGPYAYYTQNLTLRYSRKPYSLLQWGSDYSVGMSLGQFSGVMPVNGSQLHVDLWSNNSCKKIEQPFTTSSYEQKQKLVINGVSTDQYGRSYGTVSGFIFGPNGSITTSQPWIYIRPWDTTIDKEYSEVVNGTSHGHGCSSLGADGCTTSWWKTADMMDNFKKYTGPSYPDFNPIGNGTWPPELQVEQWQAYGADLFSIYGGEYNTSSEPGGVNDTLGLQRLIQFIEQNCDALVSTDKWSRWVLHQPVVSDGYHWIQPGDRVHSHYYSTVRHDYT